MTISTHLNHLIQGSDQDCTTCGRLAEADLERHAEFHTTSEQAEWNCWTCRVAFPAQWAHQYLHTLKAECLAGVEAGLDPAEMLGEFEEQQAAVVMAVQRGVMKVTTSGDLGEEIMSESTERLVAAADEILTMSDEALAAQVDAQVTKAEEEDAAEADFAAEFKNLFEDTSAGQSMALPAGQYPVRIVGCSYRLSSQSKRPQLVVTAEVGKGEFTGALMEKYLTLGTTVKAKGFFAGQLRVLGIDPEAPVHSWREVARVIADSNAPVWAEVGPQQVWQGQAKTNVKWFNSVSAPAATRGE